MAVMLGLIAAWELLVRAADIPAYTLPAPSLVAQTLVANFGSLAGSWWVTLKITFGALALACAEAQLADSRFVSVGKVEHKLLRIPLARSRAHLLVRRAIKAL